MQTDVRSVVGHCRGSAPRVDLFLVFAAANLVHVSGTPCQINPTWSHEPCSVNIRHGRDASKALQTVPPRNNAHPLLHLMSLPRVFVVQPLCQEVVVALPMALFATVGFAVFTAVGSNLVGPRGPEHSSSAFVHLFEWSWADVAAECEQWLGPKGFTGVQISPPNEHMAGEPWWTRYQPVTYRLISRSGDEQAFIDMVQRCWAVGVGIYADAVINHVAAGNGTSIAGSSYGGRSTPIFSPSDMHHFESDTSGNCFVSNYSNKWNVQYCDLLGLPDLCTACSHVQNTVAGFLNHMGEIGVAGFRFDAAQHQDAGELAQLLSKVEPRLWKFGEVTESTDPQDVHAVTPSMYTSIMDVTDFGYGSFVGQHVKVSEVGKLMSDFSWPGMMSGGNAVVFVDNHDTQRGGLYLRKSLESTNVANAKHR